MAAEDGIDAAHAPCELEIDVHAVVRQQHHRSCAFGADLVDQLLQASFLDAEGPLGKVMPRMRDRRVGEGLPDDRDVIAQHIRREDRILEVDRAHVLREELDRRQLLDRLQHAPRAVGEFPVRRHVIDAEEALRADHVGALSPQRGGGALPAVAAIEEQRVRSRGAQALDQRSDMRVPPQAAVATGGGCKIQRGESVRLGCAGRDAVVAEEGFPHQVRRMPVADVDVRLAEMDRQELRMHIGDVHERDIAEGRNVVELGGRLRETRARP